MAGLSCALSGASCCVLPTYFEATMFLSGYCGALCFIFCQVIIKDCPEIYSYFFFSSLYAQTCKVSPHKRLTLFKYIQRDRKRRIDICRVFNYSWTENKHECTAITGEKHCGFKI